MRTLKWIVVVLTLVIDLLLVTSFLPVQWERKIDYALYLWPESHGMADITHPALDHEIDQVLEEHPSLKFALYLLWVAIAVGNNYLLLRVWKSLKRRGAVARSTYS